MAFNTRASKPAKPARGTSPLRGTQVPNTTTFNGAPGFTREPKAELFLLATASFFDQDKFYETAAQGNMRFVQLVHQVAKADPRWLLDFISWLRNSANMRAASVVAGIEGAKATIGVRASVDPNAMGWSRMLAGAGIGRSDEVGEALAYWTSRYGRAIPKPIKRALADALGSLNEFGALKWDSDNSAYTLADIINLVRPIPCNPAQSDLFAWIIANRIAPTPAPDSLPIIQAREALMKLDIPARRRVVNSEQGSAILKAAGMTWESLAGWLQGPLDGKVWETIIPNMGDMALLRNLRNFDEAGISNKAASEVAARLASPVEVAKSRQLPMRFYSAFVAAPSLRWGHALSQALDFSLVNIPALSGRTLVLVDTSGSMNAPFSAKSKAARWDVAALFGIALARTSPGAELHSYSGGSWGVGAANTMAFAPTKGGTVLGDLDRWKKGGFNMGGGTPTGAALRKLFNGHDRVFVLTDEQADGGYMDVNSAIPADVPMYTFNVAGYRSAHTPDVANRYSFGGLTDQGFSLIQLIEDGNAGNWPWVQAGELS